ncbi:MAG: septum formation initiator family protein [Deltaproteobacteria bacterium]|nr:septum formation initiator family protein [Deltaproteobacteria bacterium]
MNPKRVITNRLQNYLFYLLHFMALVVFIYVTVWGKDGLTELVQLKKKKNDIVAKNNQLLKENLLFTEEIEELKNARYVEQKARSNLGMIRENELVYIVK